MIEAVEDGDSGGIGGVCGHSVEEVIAIKDSNEGLISINTNEYILSAV